MNKKVILVELCQTLRRLVDILHLDKNCQWTAKFEDDLLLCEKILDGAMLKEDIYALSNSIMYVFQGMASFNDYFPATFNSVTGRYQPISGTEDFSIISDKVFNLAKKLRESDLRV